MPRAGQFPVACCLVFAILPAASVFVRGDDPAGDESGFVPLFPSADLAGWHGSLENYVVQDGLLLCRPKKGGNIYSDAEYADFELRFDFRLTAGANNGIGLRVPDDAHAATQGLEIQILDDGHPKYAKLKPYQAHGSVYGVVPAERGHLKPVGEWNSQTIRYVGSQIVIMLNGATIVDSDLAQFVGQETPDEKEHPGLTRASGRLAFCTHGSEVDFRNLRIRRIDAPQTPAR